MKSIIDSHLGGIDAVLHLGDGAAEIMTLRRLYPKLPIHAVLGNCDGYDYTGFGIPEELFLPAEDKRLFLAHGHRHSIGTGFGTLVEYAKRRGADIALFGHCHVCHDEYIPADPGDPADRPFWLFSPGSITGPRDGKPSFGLLHISKAGVCFSVGRL